MAAWTVDEGLVTLRRQWWDAHPGATVYTIGDTKHSTDPDVSQHAPDRGTSGRPGDTRGEVDGADLMPGKGVTRDHLADLFDDLRASRDRRLLYVIFEDEIFSSVVDPWKIRPYRGIFHNHLHLSVNDNYRANTAPWMIGGQPMADPDKIVIAGGYGTYRKGMEDAAYDGYDGIKRAQHLLNWLEKSTPELDRDGVYGSKTAAKLKAFMKAAGGPASSTNGSVIGEPELRRLFGIYQVSKAS